MNQPVKLFKAEATGIMVIYFVDSMFQNLPRLLSVLGIHDHAVLEGFYLKSSLLLRAHRRKSTSFLPPPAIFHTEQSKLLITL